MKAGKSSQALAHFDNAIKLDRYCHDAFTAKGAALANNGRLMQAIKCFQVRALCWSGAWCRGGEILRSVATLLLFWFQLLAHSFIFFKKKNNNNNNNIRMLWISTQTIRMFGDI